MSEVPGPNDSAQADSFSIESDGPLRIYSEQVGIDYDAVVKQAKAWAAANPMPADLGPEPFNVGKPRPPID